MAEVTSKQVKEMIDQLAAMTAAASITPEIVASIFEKMRNLNDQEREKVIKVATEYIEEIKTTGISAEKVSFGNSNAYYELSALITEVFPLKAGITSTNAGKFEIGTTVIPHIELSITRRGVDVAAESTLGCSSQTASIDPGTKAVTDVEMNSGSKTISLRVEQGGQEVSLDPQKYEFMNYQYYGEVSTKPTASTIASVVKTLSKTLSTATTKGSTALSANKYYVFAVKGTVNFVVKNAASGGTISGCTTGYIDALSRINGTGSDKYSYVIVEKSSNSWNFKIEN